MSRSLMVLVGCVIVGGTIPASAVECEIIEWRQGEDFICVWVEENGDWVWHKVRVPEVPLPRRAGGDRAADACTPSPEFFIDAWESGDGTQQTFAPPGFAIPADFFGPGSDPFTGTIQFEGVPLGPTEYGDFGSADTLIRRSSDPFSPCDTPSEAEAEVEIQIVALSLESANPITVTYDGANDELWDVQVGLSTVPQSVGWLRAVKTHCNGGTYSSYLEVQGRFTFTKQGTGEQVVYDAGEEEQDPVPLSSPSELPWPWVHDPRSHETGLYWEVDPCSDFHPGLWDAPGPGGCDMLGTCCDPNSVCTESVTLCDCPSGRWIPGAGLCDALFPACGQWACCLSEYAWCDDLEPGACAAAGGTPLAGLLCEESPCLARACCVGDVCELTTGCSCQAMGGFFHGPPDRCQDHVVACFSDFCDTGSCCSDSGCLDNIGGWPVTFADCDGPDETFFGGITCEEDQCDRATVCDPLEQPSGSCCTDTGCELTDACGCVTLGGSLWVEDSICEELGCGACCSSQPCQELNQTQCEAAGGKYLGEGTLCDVDCPDPIPTVSEWGLVVMTLLIFVAGTVIILRSRSRRALAMS